MNLIATAETDPARPGINWVSRKIIPKQIRVSRPFKQFLIFYIKKKLSAALLSYLPNGVPGSQFEKLFIKVCNFRAVNLN